MKKMLQLELKKEKLIASWVSDTRLPAVCYSFIKATQKERENIFKLPSKVLFR